MANEIVKRGIDILISATALLLASPLLLVVAAAISLESPGAPLFKQQRIGRGGVPFSMLKLRSMVKNAAAMGSYQTLENDPRLTRIGKFVRATSLDELPQLLNVLAGDMSLVGPRPETPAQRALYTDADWEMRHRVRPGITGLAQVSGRSDISKQDRLRYDLAYVANPTLSLDFSILRRTLWLALSRGGVN
jgi:lipopolysaccharide/colanic/teichoic acid biosynthesis glycosyltransferase